jgi:predicted amidohydrolase
MVGHLLKIGIVQPCPLSRSFEEFRNGGDIPHACEIVRTFEDRVDIVCLPELYPYKGEIELARLARELRICIVAGIVEETSKASYNTATIFSRDGVIIGRQRKKYLTLTEVERDGVIPGSSYEIFSLEDARIGIAICADMPFFPDWEVLIEKKVDIVINPSRWFALSDLYPTTIVSRHLQFGIPVIGINWAKFSFPEWREMPNGFPPAGGHSTITNPPPVACLRDLADWFRTKTCGIDSGEDLVTVLGEKEETAIVSIDIEAVRKFPGYFYNDHKP